MRPVNGGLEARTGAVPRSARLEPDWRHFDWQLARPCCYGKAVDQTFKGIVHPRIKVLSSFTRPQVDPNQHEARSSVKSIGFEECLWQWMVINLISSLKKKNANITCCVRLFEIVEAILCEEQTKINIHWILCGLLTAFVIFYVDLDIFSPYYSLTIHEKEWPTHTHTHTHTHIYIYICNTPSPCLWSAT